MAMRLSGLMSGMDTDSIIQELVAVKKTKVDAAKKAQTKLEWKQDAWKSLNTKLKSLQSKYLSNMRFSSAYMKKTTKVSNSSAVSVITGENAVNGVQSLRVDKLAKTGYLTGACLRKEDGKEFSAMSTMADLGLTEGGTFSVKTGDTMLDITVSLDTKISDVLTQIKDAGLNASFDANNQRFFISAKESGLKNDFSITASDEGGAQVLQALGLQTSADEAAVAQYEKYASYYVEGADGNIDRNATVVAMQDLIDAEVEKKTAVYLEQYKTAVSSLETANSKIQEIQDKYADGTVVSVGEGQTLLEAMNAAIEEKQSAIDGMEDGEDKTAAEKELKELKADAEALDKQQKTVEELETKIDSIEKQIDITSTEEDGKKIYTATAIEATLVKDIEDSFVAKVEYAKSLPVEDGKIVLASSGATKVNAQDAKIYLNDAEFTSNSNVFEINGLTFTALSETAKGEEVTITTQDDTDGIYDMIKGFLKEYNTLINEMDKLYNAESAKGYEPLTDEEKDAMSEKEVEKWEEKIKGSLLRRDSAVNDISSALKSIMSSGIEVGGETLYLSNFGINTLGYFNAPDNEKNAYHIDGDPDNENTSGNADKLKSLISSNPDKVVDFFSQLSQNLYNKMSDMSKSQDGYRSFGSFYDDKKMKEDYSDYTSKIAELEEKLADYEDKWYAKFAAMETAMAKMQKNASAVTSLIGGL